MFGTVSKYDRIRGVGFIVPDDLTLPDLLAIPKFIDANRYMRFLIACQRVEFEPADMDTKPIAHNIRVIPTVIAAQRSGPPTGGTK